MAEAIRHTKYDADEHPKLLRELVGEGRTFCDIAQAFGIAPFTLTEWRHKYPSMAVAVKLGRDDQDARVERALFERACGYSHPSEKIVVVSDGKEGGSHVERVDITEHYPPDAASLKFWLTNRRSKEWRDKTEVEMTDRASRLAAARSRKGKSE